MRIVLDTDVLVAAIQSPTGASREILSMILSRKGSGALSIAVSTALFLEYEAVLLRSERLAAAKASPSDIADVLNGLAEVAVPVGLAYRLRPTGAHADDELVVETAVNGIADVIATFNVRHVQSAAARFGIAVETPSKVLRRIRS